MTITCYVSGRDLIVYDTAETIRLATAAERAESYSTHDGGVGAISVDVSERTLRSRCPMWVRMAADPSRHRDA